jgi:DNA-binding Lrp family transcriptional regulator
MDKNLESWTVVKKKELIHLDNKNKKLLEILLTDARVPLNVLAKELKISKVAVSKRINKLEEQNVIQGYSCFIDLQKLGFHGYQIGIRTKVTLRKKHEFFLELLKERGLSQILSFQSGRWDFLIRVYAKNDDVKELIKKISENEFIEEINLFNIDKIQIKTNKKIIITENKKVKFDNIDLNILNILARNGKISFVDIASRLKVNIATIKYRIKELEKKGIILFYVTAIDTSLLNKETFVISATAYGINEENHLIRNLIDFKNSTGGILNKEYPNIFAFYMINEFKEIDQIENVLISKYHNVKYELFRISEQNYYNFFPEAIFKKLIQNKC